jgi:hypothetical protein
MDRFNEQRDELIDLGSATTETKGPPVGTELDFLIPNRDNGNGLSDD